MPLGHGVRVSLPFSPVAQRGKHNMKCNWVWAINNYMYGEYNNIINGITNMTFFGLQSKFCGLVDVPTCEGEINGQINEFSVHSKFNVTFDAEPS